MPSSGVRLVLDTNTAISGLLWGGTPGTLIDAAASGRIELASTLALLAELQGVLSRTKFSSQLARRSLTLGDVFNGYATLVAIVSPATITPTVISDPADDEVLAAGVGAHADMIVSGDTHLLSLGSFQGINIVTAAVAVARIATVV